ncbi:MAG: PAS domain S-box protein, partial [Deltaproteobacteria bacterium]|nr:PAS domain S-box protein [Deltaproteobacteria bacterium]
MNKTLQRGLRARSVAMTSRDPGGEAAAIVRRFMTTLAARLVLVLRFDEGMKGASKVRLESQLAVVDEVARVLTSTLDINDVYGEFAQQLGELVDFDRIAIAVFDQDSGTFNYKYRHGQAPPVHDERHILPLEGTRTQEVFMTGQTLVAEDISSQPQYSSDPGFSNMGLVASIHIPLVYKGQVFGTLILRSKKVAAFGQREQAIIERVASQIAPSVRNAQLYERSMQVENELRQSEAKAQALLESAPQGIIATSGTGEIVQVNNAASEIFGYSRDELLGQPVDMLLPQELQPGHAAHRESYFSEAKVRRMGMGRDLHGLRKDGSIVPLEIGLSFSPTQDGDVALAFITDITERKVAEEAERRWAEENLVMAGIGRFVNSSLDVDQVYQQIGSEVGKLIDFDRLSINVIDQENGTAIHTCVTGIDIPELPLGRTIPLSESVSGLAARTKTTQLIQPRCEQEIADLFPVMVPLYRAGLNSFMVVPLISQGEVVAILSLQSKEVNAYSDGDIRVAELIGAQIAGAIANSRLYAEIKSAEEALREGEERYRDLYDHTPVMMHSIDRDGHLLSVNDYWLKASGYERSEVIGSKTTDFFTEESRRHALEVALPEFWKTGFSSELEYQMVKKNGDVMDVLLTGVLQREKTGEIEYSRTFLVDVTERRRAEDSVKASL